MNRQFYSMNIKKAHIGFANHYAKYFLKNYLLTV